VVVGWRHGVGLGSASNSTAFGRGSTIRLRRIALHRKAAVVTLARTVRCIPRRVRAGGCGPSWLAAPGCGGGQAAGLGGADRGRRHSSSGCKVMTGFSAKIRPEVAEKRNMTLNMVG
jgi:hypothetical protein